MPPRYDGQVKKIFYILVISLVWVPCFSDAKPNILFIYLDDFGWKDTSYMGSDFFETPHIDKLAGEGMIFTNAYSAAANCAPARACLLSGQYTPRHEIYNVGTGPRGKSAFRKLEHVPGVSTLKPEIKTWAHCLQEAGYRTATMGKWHLSKDPLPYGFDINIGGTHSGGPPKGYYPPHPGVPNLGEVPLNEYLTDTLSKRACDFIRENKSRNWALYLTHFAVHTPIQAKKELLKKYGEKKPGDQHDNIEMATMIQSVDDGVGEIMAELEAQGIRDNTVILFFSDNGGYGPATDMAPLKGYKGTYYEGGIRVPFFVNWPGMVRENQKNDTPIIGVDLYPTLCEIAGAVLPSDQALDGRSLLPLFRGAVDDEWKNRSLFWHFPAYLQSYNRIDGQRDLLFRSRPCSIVRRGDWKLHHYFENDEYELYNLREDIGETRNLADSDQERLSELRSALDRWRNQIDAPVPRNLNPRYDPEAEEAEILRLSRRLEASNP